MTNRPATPPRRHRTPLRQRPNRSAFSLLEQLEARRLLAGDGLRAAYFDNIDFTAPRVDRVDPQVNFDWGYGAPAAGMGADHFSVRWSGQVEAPATGTFNFHTYSDDGVRLWVNNQLIINNWTDHAPREDTGSIALVAGQKYAIKMEYYERGNGAVARLLWSGPGVSKQLIPQARLYSTATPIHRPTITLSTLRDSINETGEPNVSAFSFRRIGLTDDRISLRYELSGTAKHYLDYLLPLPDHISAGSSGTNYTLQALDDGEHEGPETVTMRLLPSDDYIISGPDTVTVTINDDDPLPNPLPQISVTAATRPAVEGGSPAWGAFNFTRTGDISKRLVVEFALDGTATQLADYDIGNANLFHVTFEAGSATTGVAVHPKDDALVEGDETVTLSIVPRSSAFTIAGSGQATQTIVDNDVPPDAGDGVWVSELDWVSATSPFSGIKKDRATSGNPLRIGGTTYERGLGVHSPSSITYNLGGKYTRFTSYVGIDDAVGNGSRDGSAVFEVWVDGVRKKASSRRTGADPAELLDVDVTGAQTLRLVTTTGGDNDYKDHADWADAKLYSGPAVSRPTVNVGLGQPTALEDGSRTGMFWISRDAADDTPLTVQYTISGTATAGTDYRALSGSATIPAGERGIIIRVEALEDDLLEGTETVVLTLSPSAAYNSGTSPSATVNILDNETAPVLPSITLYAYDAAAAEVVAAWGQFQVSRTGSTAEPLVVHYTIGGTATNGVDYEQLPGSVTIPANSHIAFFYVKPIDDLLYEGDETVTLTLSPSTAYTTGTPATATVTIADNEQPPVGGEPVYLSDLDWTSATSPFGGVRKDRTNSGGALRIGGVTYDKGLGVHSPSSITYNLDGQYTRFTAAVGIDDAVGNGSRDGSAVFEVWVDGVLKKTSTRRTGADPAEFIDVDLTGAQTLRLVTTTGGDNDYKDHADWADAKLLLAKPTVHVASSQPAREGGLQGIPTPALFRFTRYGTSDLSMPLDVHYTLEGLATPEADYTGAGPIVDGWRTFTIPAHKAAATLTLEIVDDTVWEPAETIVLRVREDDSLPYVPSDAARQGVTTAIIDNDSPIVTLSFAGATLAEATADEDGVLTVSRRGDLSAPLTVDLRTAGNAIDGIDYTAIPDSVTLPAGAASMDLPLSAIDDDIHEGTEWLMVSIAPSDRYTISGEPVTLDLLDSDTPLVRLTPVHGTEVREDHVNGGSGVYLRLEREGELHHPLVVPLNFSGTAIRGDDYDVALAEGDFYHIPAGVPAVEFQLYALNDHEVEDEEYVTISVDPAFTRGATEQQTIRVLDNATVVKPEVSAVWSGFSYKEGSSDEAVIELRVWGGVYKPFDVHYTLSGTAVAGEDYIAPPLSVTFERGQDRAYIRFPLLDDAISEATEAITLTIQPDDAYWINIASASAWIEDDDVPVVTITTIRDAVEGGTPGIFEISRTGDLVALDLHVAYSGTADSDDVDFYTPLRFGAGDPSISWSANVPFDGFYEDEESLTMTILPDPVYLIDQASATMRIFDAPGSGLRGTYFTDEFVPGGGSRIEPVNFDAGAGLPWSPPGGSDHFSVRWQGYVDPPVDGTYTFYFDHDQHARVWIDGVLVGDTWHAPGGSITRSIESDPMALQGSRKIPILIEYREFEGVESAVLSWSYESSETQVTKRAIPAAQLYPPRNADPTPLKIITLGDSITEGEKGHASYRFWLDRALASSDISHEMVGTRSGVHNSWVGGDNVQPLYPWFDQDHQSRWGAHLDELRQQVGQWADQSPDIALIHIGHNDIRGGQSPQSLIDELSLFIDQLRGVNPAMKIAVALPVRNTSLGFVAEMDQYRALIPALVASKTTVASPIIVVDQYAGFDPATMTYDNVHPNEIGEKQIAGRFYDAILALLQASPT